MKPKKLFFLTLLPLLPLVACASDVPTARDGRSVLESHYISLVSNKKLNISNFEKINGAKAELFGRELYELEFSAELEYPDGIMPECTKEALAEAPKATRRSCNNAIRTTNLTPKAVGAQEELTGKLVFEKTEKGWRGRDGKIY